MSGKMADWNEIEAAYVAGGGSYRQVAARYGVGFSAVKRRGKRGSWVQKREEYGGQLRQALLDADKAARCDRFVKLNRVADRLLERVEELTDAAEVSPASLKTLSETLKNIRDAQMLKGRLDAAEQEMRIEKLRKEMGRAENQGQVIRVVLDGAEAFAG